MNIAGEINQERRLVSRHAKIPSFAEIWSRHVEDSKKNIYCNNKREKFHHRFTRRIIREHPIRVFIRKM